MEVFQTVQSMLAVREYADRPVPDDVIGRILEAARLTASSKNRQEWDFVVVRDRETLEQLGEMAQTGRYIAQAAFAVAVVVTDAPVGYIDGARATQDMMLVAWEAGIGSNWVANVNKDEIKALLNIPRDRMLLNIIPFGYPAEEIGASVQKDRKPLSDIAHDGRFGKPFYPDNRAG